MKVEHITKLHTEDELLIMLEPNEDNSGIFLGLGVESDMHYAVLTYGEALHLNQELREFLERLNKK
jgi:hypothetical protein